MKDFLVSVIVWTYNHEKYIAQALQSIVDQERDFELEIIVGDDFSTDGAREVLIDYAVRYPFIKLLLPEKNQGAKENVIQTLLNVQGKYLAFIDGDDYWCNPQKLIRQVDYMESNPDISLCFNNVRIEGGKNDQTLAYSPGRKKYIDCYDLMSGDFTHTNATVIRNKPGLFDPVINGILPGADTVLFLLPLLEGSYGYFFSEVFSVYRVHPGGIYSMRSIDNRFRQNQEETFNLIGYLKNEKFAPFLRRRYTDLVYHYSIALANDLQLFKAIFYHLKFMWYMTRELNYKKVGVPYYTFFKRLFFGKQ